MASVANPQLKRNCFESLDRINSLPEEVITKILVHLPIRNAVATSRLSRRWRFRWMSLPELVFDSRSAILRQTPNQWIDFINNVLLLHGGDVTKVEIRNLSFLACSYVDRWLILLQRRKNLSHLGIRFKTGTRYRCPSTLFNSQDLKTLVLKGCELQLPPQTQFNGFKNLTTLRLHWVTVNKETIEFLVNNSPHLRDLNLSLWDTISHLSISAPNLSKCTVDGTFESITLIKTPKLQFISIRKLQFISIRELQHGLAVRSKLDGILGELVQVQNCRIFHPFVEFLSFKNFWEREPTIYCHLKHVILGMDFGDPQQILAAHWLFRSSPFLKTIRIIVVPVNHGVHHEDLCMEEFYEALDKREAILRSLEIVEFTYLAGSKYELRFIQFLILHANVLQTMKIGPVGTAKEGALLFKLLMFPRTSLKMKFDLSGWESSC